MLKIRRPLGRLIFNMGIAIPGKTVFLIETAPWSFNILSRLTTKNRCEHLINPTPGSEWASLIDQSLSVDSQCTGCLGQALVTLRLPCTIVETPWRHKHVPFVNIAYLRSRSMKRRQWSHKLDYYDVVFAHLATVCGINAKDHRGWIQIVDPAFDVLRETR